MEKLKKQPINKTTSAAGALQTYGTRPTKLKFEDLNDMGTELANKRFHTFSSGAGATQFLDSPNSMAGSSPSRFLCCGVMKLTRSLI